MLSRASTIACACAKPRARSPTEPGEGPATLSGHSSKTRVAPGASAASTVAAAGNVSYRTSTASAASAAPYASSATTTATASPAWRTFGPAIAGWERSEEHTSELQSHSDLVCRLLLED